ncbi:MAG: GntR family transcriptional regulator [Bacillota bacterium]
MPLNKDKRPLYIRIKEYLENEIDKGTYKEGDKLPSENKLSDLLDVSRASLREALRVLEEEGKIIKHQGIGTFVNNTSPKFKKGIEKLNSVTETIEKGGYEAGTTHLNIKELNISESFQEKIYEESGEKAEKILRIERVRTANEEPVVYCLDHLLLKYLNKDYSKEYFSNSLFEVLNDYYNINVKKAITNIIAISSDNYISKMLNIKNNESLLLLEQYHYDNKNRMILFSQNYFRSDQFQFKVIRNR